jgi:Cytochrome b/b6/petB
VLTHSTNGARHARFVLGTENGAPFEIYYADHGSRQPVVLIDGYPLNAEVVTGIFLAMFYRPSATEAYSSVEHITTDVFLGEFVRGLSGGARR